MQTSAPPSASKQASAAPLTRTQQCVNFSLLALCNNALMPISWRRGQPLMAGPVRRLIAEEASRC
jgi:hypothetical protein